MPPPSSATIAPYLWRYSLFQICSKVLRNSRLAQGSCQVTSSEHTADPPDLKTAKDQGDQTQLGLTPLSLDLAGKVVTVLDCGIEDLLEVVEKP